MLLEGAPAAQLLRHAAVTNAPMDDAMQFVHLELWPAVAARPHTWTVHASTAYLGGLLQVPNHLANCDDAALNTCPYATVSADGYLAHAGGAYRWDTLGVFYAAGFFGMRGTNMSAYPVSALGSAALAAINTPFAPLTAGPLRIHNFNALAWGFAGWGAQYMVGGTAQFAGIEGRLGYSGGSAGNGVLLSAGMRTTGLEAAFLWRPAFNDVGYGWAGLWHAPVLAWIFPGNPQLPATTTSLFLRIQAWGVPPSPLPPSPVDGVRLWALHLRQHDIPFVLGTLEARLAVGVAPQAYLQEAAVAWHTAQPNAVLDLGLSAGVVGQPPLQYFDIQGGGRFYAAAELSHAQLGGIAVAFNAADMLNRLPFAQNTLAINLHCNFDALDGGAAPSGPVPSPPAAALHGESP